VRTWAPTEGALEDPGWPLARQRSIPRRAKPLGPQRAGRTRAPPGPSEAVLGGAGGRGPGGAGDGLVGCFRRRSSAAARTRHRRSGPVHAARRRPDQDGKSTAAKPTSQSRQAGSSAPPAGPPPARPSRRSAPRSQRERPREERARSEAGMDRLGGTIQASMAAVRRSAGVSTVWYRSSGAGRVDFPSGVGAQPPPPAGGGTAASDSAPASLGGRPVAAASSPSKARCTWLRTTPRNKTASTTRRIGQSIG
jgi:hypothetical protein